MCDLEKKVLKTLGISQLFYVRYGNDINYNTVWLQFSLCYNLITNY